MAAVLERRRDVLCVLPTGGGKSFLFMVPALLERELVTVVVVPLIALLRDLARRCEEVGVPVCCWRDEPAADNMLTTTAGFLPGVCLVDISQASGGRFLTALRKTANTGRLARVVFDECHLMVSWSGFRGRDMGIGTLIGAQPGCHATPFVMLSATVPPQAESKVAAGCFGCVEPFVVRAFTDRMNLKYVVTKISRNDVDAMTSAVERSITACSGCLEDDGRALVYTRSRTTAESLAVRLTSRGYRAGFYHAGMGDNGRKSSVRNWRDGTTRVLVCTTAFSFGVDYSSVRLVVHAGLPFSLSQYAQEVGRAGRDGLASMCNLLFPPFFSTSTTTEEDVVEDEEATKMLEWARGKTLCRRLRLQLFLDGPSCLAKGPCRLNSLRQLCDVCEELEEQQQKRGTQIAAISTESGDPGDVAGGGTVSSLTVVAGRRSAAEFLEAETQTALQLVDILREMKGSHVCGFCYLLGHHSDFSHKPESCFRQGKGMCFQCGAKGGCIGNSCKLKAEVSYSVNLHFLCSRCFLPNTVGSIDLHERVSTVATLEEGETAFLNHRECVNGGGRFIWLLAMHLFRDINERSHLLEPCVLSLTAEDQAVQQRLLSCQRKYARWLVDCPKSGLGLPNIAKLIVCLYNKQRY